MPIATEVALDAALGDAPNRRQGRRLASHRENRLAPRTFGRAHAAGIALVALVLGGCPQLLEDDFRLGGPSLDNGGGGLNAGGGSDDTGAGGNSAAGGASPTCGNGIQDNGETDLDCGGSCAPCGCTERRFGVLEPLTVQGLPTGSSLFGPALSADGLSLFFSSQSTDDTQDLNSASRGDGGEVFSAATRETFSRLNTSANETSPRISADGLHLYFCSEFSNPMSTGGGDIYLSTRTSTTSAFGLPTAITATNSTALDNPGWLSPDELNIYFASKRTNSPGGANLWSAQRASRTASFGAPRALNELNTEADDQSPSLSPNQLTIFFTSDRGGAGSSGKFDIWTATRASLTSPFGAPVIVSGVNSAADELDVSVSSDGTELVFSSDRNGAEHTIWRAAHGCQ